MEDFNGIVRVYNIQLSHSITQVLVFAAFQLSIRRWSG